MILIHCPLANSYQCYTLPGEQCGLDKQIGTRYCVDITALDARPATDQMGSGYPVPFYQVVLDRGRALCGEFSELLLDHRRRL